MAEGWLQVAQEALKVPALLVEIYGDLAKPGVRQAGRALETVIGLGNTILWPIALTNERARLSLERNLEKYRKEMESVPEEKVVGISPEIGVPIAEKLSYITDERLSNLYVRLLAAASNMDTLGDAHPSFVNVINNMSPDEAHVLEYFSQHVSLPFVKAKAVVEGARGHIVISGCIVHQSALVGINFPLNIDAYLSNLEGLGLLDIRNDEWLANEAIYVEIQDANRASLTKFIADTPALTGRALEFKKGVVSSTSFGKKFIAACHKK